MRDFVPVRRFGREDAKIRRRAAGNIDDSEPK
jgi:hypothetical protein